ncbi:MAG TPA: DUF2382 domain-containing protein [Tepidiformaceae bacterium]|nr:DUF2382 domain-containing protein [Tepidiformaceae bacterium]
MAGASHPARFPDPGRSFRKLRKGDKQERHDLPAGESVELVRHEQEAAIQPELRDAGKMRLRKRVEQVLAQASLGRHVEQSDIEHLPANAMDSGQVEYLPDGSISIPIFEEEIVVTKRMVVRERVVVRKDKRTERVVVPVELQRERLEIEADPGLKGRIKRE